MTKPKKTIDKRVAELKELGPVRNNPVIEGRITSYAIGQSQFEIAREGFFALMARYGISQDDVHLIISGVSYMYFWSHAQALAESDVTIERLAEKIKWQ